MKIMIIGSMAFAKEMITMKKKLEKLGHDAQVPHGIEPHLIDQTFVDTLDANKDFCIENDIMRQCFQLVAESDAVLVLNHKRNNIDGYIGVSALMELGVGHFFRKKIFLFNPIPSYSDHRWVHEVEIMQPVIINGDLSKIK